MEKKRKKTLWWWMRWVFFLQDPAWELTFWSTPSQCCLSGDNFCAMCLPGPSVYLGFPVTARRQVFGVWGATFSSSVKPLGFAFSSGNNQLLQNALMWHCRTMRIPLGLPFPGGDVCSSQYEVTAAALSLMPCNHVIPHPVRKCKKCSQNQKLQRFLSF